MTRNRTHNRGEQSGGAVVSLHGRGKRTLADRSSLFASRSDDHDDTIGTRSAAPGSRNALTASDLAAVEATYAHGITAPQIVEVFTSRGLKFSEATFRKYVQLGLLPRSKRIGRKGKYRGSLGVYPSKTVRRINSVKEWMADGYTIEEIHGQFLHYTDLVEGIEESFEELCSRLVEKSQTLPTEADRKSIGKDVSELRKDSQSLLRRIGETTRKIAGVSGREIRRAGAAGSAEDLL